MRQMAADGRIWFVGWFAQLLPRCRMQQCDLPQGRIISAGLWPNREQLVNGNVAQRTKNWAKNYSTFNLAMSLKFFTEQFWDSQRYRGRGEASLSRKAGPRYESDRLDENHSSSGCFCFLIPTNFQTFPGAKAHVHLLLLPVCHSHRLLPLCRWFISNIHVSGKKKTKGALSLPVPKRRWICYEWHRSSSRPLPNAWEWSPPPHFPSQSFPFLIAVMEVAADLRPILGPQMVRLDPMRVKQLQ